MSGAHHHATVDKGLKMKIKRKNVSSKSDGRHEVSKNDTKTGNIPVNDNPITNTQTAMAEKLKGGLITGTSGEKSKVKSHKKDKSAKDVQGKAGQMDVNNTTPPRVVNSTSNCLDLPSPMEPKVGDQAVCKKDNTPVDPYEFNAKIEDASVSMPMKKAKIDKMGTPTANNLPSYHSVSTETCNVGVVTEPECLGPCEPGTSVTLEGIVWHETEQGVLVVNVTWRGKTYVGTLLDATKHDWAPPRLGCDSPVSDLEARTPKGRGKRGRMSSNTPVSERSIAESRKLRKTRRGTMAATATTTTTTTTTNTFTAPPSPAKSDQQGTKRKSRPADLDILNNSDGSKPAKRTCSSSRGNTPNVESPLSGSTLIECPEPNCNKKYKHINGLRYHQAHSHPKSSLSISTDNILDLNLAKDDTDMDCTDENGDEPSIPDSSKSKDNNSSGKSETLDHQIDEKHTDVTIGSKDFSSGVIDSYSSDNSKADKNDDRKSKNATTKASSNMKPKNLTSSPTATTKSLSPGSQVFQITSAPIGCLGSIYSQSLVSSTANSSMSGSPCVTVSSGQMSTNSVTVTTVTSNKVSESGKDGKHLKADKLKGKGSARPIMPAPTPQVMSLSTNVSVTHSNLAPVSTHAQSSPSLKPIQPKPTIMGEPCTVNPALSSLKDKRPKIKKKKVPTATLR